MTTQTSTETTEQATAPQLGKTANGVEITEGLIVFTNEMRAGKVRLDRCRTSDDGWFDVEYADGRRVMQNGDRVATSFQGRSAKQVWAQDMLDREADL